MRPRWMVRILTCFVLTLGTLANAHAADHQASDDDIRCIVVAIHMGASAVPAQRAASAVVAMYYFGRLDSNYPGADVERLIEQDNKRMTLADLRANAARCAKAIEEKSREFAQIGADLSRNEGGQSRH
jgi:hypothetical protein